MIRSGCSIVVLAVLARMACAETGYDAWLRYAPIDPAAQKMYRHLPAAIFVAADSRVLETAKNELILGVHGMLGKTLHLESRIAAGDAVMLATYDVVHGIVPTLITPPQSAGYLLKAMRLDGHFVYWSRLPTAPASSTACSHCCATSL